MMHNFCKNYTETFKALLKEIKEALNNLKNTIFYGQNDSLL
jgi:hypothetical protein